MYMKRAVEIGVILYIIFSMKCVFCEIEGHKKIRKGEVEVEDQITGERVLLCRHCYKKWIELNSVKFILYENKEETDKQV